MASTEIAQSHAAEQEPDTDALKLAEMGYKQDMKRNFSLWSVLGVAFSLTNSWFGISASMITGINSGGPVLLVYGIILVAIITSCAAISLSELASSMPSAGGQYFWANELAPPRYANFAGYLTGCFAWVGSIFTTSSVAFSMATAVVGLYQLTHESFEIKTWHIIVAYQALNAVAFLFNSYGKVLPTVASATFYISLLSFAVILVTVPSYAPSHNSAEFVFATFINNTGWHNNGIAFMIGLMNPEWAFACLDCATHMAEEVSKPEKTIPLAICCTVAIGFCTAWPFAIGMMFSIQDLTRVTFSPTGVPIIEIFHQSINVGAACILETLVILTGTGCLIACHTWQTRLCWSFARDAGLPGHKWLKQVHPKLEVPLAAHFVSCAIVALVGFLYWASTAAFSSTVTACIVLLYISYSIPVICILIRGRSNIRHGPFWVGDKLGLVANYILLAWTFFIVVIYSFPTKMPVSGRSMNYVSAVYVVLALAMLLDWGVRARWEFRGPLERKLSVTAGEGGMRLRHSVPATGISAAAGGNASGGSLLGARGEEAGGNVSAGVHDIGRKAE